MTPLGAVVSASVVGVVGALAVVSGWAQERPTLERAVARLHRAPVTERPTAGTDGAARAVGRVALGLLGPKSPVLPSSVVLRLGGRSAETHAAYLIGAVVSGFLGPVALVGTLAAVGIVPLGVQLPLAVGLAGAVLAPLVVHGELVERAGTVRIDLRHQLSAYLDVVTMLLAGNSGHEGALEHAAHAGDGRLFRELRRRMREVGASGRSLVDALDLTGRELGLVELQQVAATTSLSAAEGAPVARTLAAKCATLRSTLASEQESEARLRTSRLTPPLVGMSLIFMALVIYPALSFGR